MLPLDTVMQPKIKKKKSVGKLEVKDTNKASKYLLTTQEVDCQGHTETKLVKVRVETMSDFPLVMDSRLGLYDLFYKIREKCGLALEGALPLFSQKLRH